MSRTATLNDLSFATRTRLGNETQWAIDALDQLIEEAQEARGKLVAAKENPLASHWPKKRSDGTYGLAHAGMRAEISTAEAFSVVKLVYEGLPNLER